MMEERKVTPYLRSTRTCAFKSKDLSGVFCLGHSHVVYKITLNISFQKARRSDIALNVVYLEKLQKFG